MLPDFTSGRREQRMIGMICRECLTLQNTSSMERLENLRIKGSYEVEVL